MNSYTKLIIATLLPVMMTCIIYYLEQIDSVKKISYKVKQTVIGILFGILAVIGTEWGIPINGAQMNCRDAAVLTAGLLFGGPAGIIAGTIGAVERYIAVAWGVGRFTRVACSVSTFIAGIYAALLRRFMFENKRPGTFISLAMGVVIEVFHLTMVFITNMSTPVEAMAVIKSCTVPMVTANALSVMLSAMVLGFLRKDHISSLSKDQVRISQTIQRWLLLTVVFAFFCTSLFVFRLQSQMVKRQSSNLMRLSLTEAREDIISAGGNEKYISELIRNRNIGETGYVLLFDKNGFLLGAPKFFSGAPVNKVKFNEGFQNHGEAFATYVNGEKCLCRCGTEGEYSLVAVYPEEEAYRMRDFVLYVNSFLEVLVFAALFAMIYMLIKRVVVRRLNEVNRSLAKITAGDLEEVVNVRSNEEFAFLSDDINATVNTLKRYIAEAAARIDKELEFAKNIQISALPNTFPAFPKRKEFDIFASMDPAKEVGGDFYDFYFTGNNLLNILVADVSGKGIPAAMFMMRAKAELKSLTEAGNSLDQVFTGGNEKLCSGNDAGMFVTAWQGTIDLKRGIVRYVNAGHNPPLLCREGKFDYLKSRAGFVLAGMEGVRYKTMELELQPGDIIFLYTDGVTEATNADNELYGEDRLLSAVNQNRDEPVEVLCRNVRKDIDAFVGEAPQFDDMTMLALRYFGTPAAPSITIEKAVIRDLDRVTEFIESELARFGLSMKYIMQIDVAADEIFTNIVSYGYTAEEPGDITVSVYGEEDMTMACVQFTDKGIPYNPLTHKDPDVTLSAEERSIGGLGIYMVKNTMDVVKYEYQDGCNILTIKKHI